MAASVDNSLPYLSTVWLLHSKSGPGGTLYHYGLCELAQRQAVFVRKDNPPVRAIKSDRAKVVMTAGCIKRTEHR